MTLTALPGGRAHHSAGGARARFAADLDAATRNIQASGLRNLRPTHPTTIVDLELALADVHLLLAALLAPGVAPRLRDIGIRIRDQLHPSQLPPAGDDDCPPHGIARPVTS